VDLIELGGTIRAARQAAGISQGDLARMAGCSRVTVNYAEGGRVAVGADVLIRLLRPLGLCIADTRTTAGTNALELLARLGSVSYRDAVAPADVASAFATGAVDERWLPHVATILDEAPDALLLRAIRTVADREGLPATTVWRTVRRLAADIGSPHPRWQHAA